jgi:hypothetical protein
MELIKLLRLNNGEDLISYVEDYGTGEVILRSPMAVLVKHDPRTNKQTVLMDHWLPTSIIMKNEVVLKTSEILCTMDSSSAINEYYENAIMTIDKFNNSDASASSDEELTQEEMSIIMDQGHLVGSKLIH